MSTSKSAISPKGLAQGNRQLSTISAIHPVKKTWTCLIQVIERQATHEFQGAMNQPVLLYINYVLTDMQNLLPYRRYYVSNAKVKPANPLYKLDNYEYYWVISKSTLVESFNEHVPPMLPCKFEFTRFSDLHTHADKPSLLCIRALVVADFPTVTVSETKTSKDFIIIDEEKIHMLLRVWNELTESAELTLHFKDEPIVVIATKLKVSTYDGLTLATRTSTYFMVNPPLEEDVCDVQKLHARN